MPNELRQFQNDNKESPLNMDSDYSNSQEEVVEKLAKYGFTELGRGIGGAVFGHPKHEYVMKVFYHDPAYLTWFKFCKANQNNPYVPKIKGKLIRVIPNREMYAIRMEPLEPISETRYNTELYDILNGVLFHGHDYRKYTTDDDLGAILTFIRQCIESGERNEDLHPGNIMQRSNGHLVFTDPLG